MKKIFTVIVIALTLIVSGCSKKEDEKYFSKTDKNIVKQEKPEYVNNENIVGNKSEKEEIVSYFDNLDDEVSKCINSSRIELVKDKVINMAVTGIDFVFYGKEINGVTFEELSDETKIKIRTIVSNIDRKVENSIPGYKDTVKTKFGQGYEYISNKLNYGLDYVDNKLEEKYGEQYNNVKNKFSELKEDAKEETSNTIERIKDTTSIGIDKIKEWYENKTGKR